MEIHIKHRNPTHILQPKQKYCSIAVDLHLAREKNNTRSVMSRQHPVIAIKSSSFYFAMKCLYLRSWFVSIYVCALCQAVLMLSFVFGFTVLSWLVGDRMNCSANRRICSKKNWLYNMMTRYTRSNTVATMPNEPTYEGGGKTKRQSPNTHTHNEQETKPIRSTNCEIKWCVLFSAWISGICVLHAISIWLACNRLYFSRSDALPAIVGSFFCNAAAAANAEWVCVCVSLNAFKPDQWRMHKHKSMGNSIIQITICEMEWWCRCCCCHYSSPTGNLQAKLCYRIDSNSTIKTSKQNAKFLIFF